ncbi:SRPBCC family protein [Aquimarina muelleri]|uniref:ATPase n=1 Tax=Aquimarina muelleri TaxID=279356 RepID=A0A918JY30_9FLAO|nr:SRPBCC domain-containing protein [Aquimarina muelleri]MCX2763838.1 SRPBCC domain-containing protein [Aquimarina muelleri]GGX29382.1 ATPase [Aquimarina muelleri]
MKTEIKHKWFYNQSVEVIWEYLTKAELIEKWLMPNDFEPIVGHEFKFTTNPVPGLALDGIFYCKVLEITPLKKLVYSWKGGSSKNKVTFDTIVEWTLESKDNGTELRLVHSGFKEENGSILTAMFDGWDKNIQKMFNHIKSE